MKLPYIIIYQIDCNLHYIIYTLDPKNTKIKQHHVQHKQKCRVQTKDTAEQHTALVGAVDAAQLAPSREITEAHEFARGLTLAQS